MREILFRGKRTDNGEWVYGNLIFWHGDHDKPCVETHYRHGFGKWHSSVYDVDPATVGQYTELTDNNGKRVFEGDILYLNGNYFGVVAWHPNGHFCIDDRDNPKPLSRKDVSTPIGWMLNRLNFAVSGNIHDNPELMKGGAE